MTITVASPSQSGAGNVQNSATTIAYVYPNALTPGQMVRVSVGSTGSGAFTAANCTKTAGTATLGAITLDKGQLGSSNTREGIWSAVVAPGGGGTLTLTVNLTTTSFAHIGGNVLNASNGWDVAANRVENINGANFTTSTTPTSGTAASAGGGYFAGVLGVDNSAAVTLTPGSSFTSIFASLNGTANFVGDHTEFISATGATLAASWTISAAPAESGAAVVAYKEMAPTGSTPLMGMCIWMTA